VKARAFLSHFLPFMGKSCVIVGTLLVVFGALARQPNTMWVGVAFVMFGALFEVANTFPYDTDE
jgi:hypothetical protein